MSPFRQRALNNGATPRTIPATCEIEAYMHCGNCLQRRPDGVSPQEWARLSVGWTDLGLQVWCYRCEMNVLHVDFEGQQHRAATHGLIRD